MCAQKYVCARKNDFRTLCVLRSMYNKNDLRNFGTKINSKKKAKSGKRQENINQENKRCGNYKKVENMHTKIIHESGMYSMKTNLKSGELRRVLNYQKNKKIIVTERVVKIIFFLSVKKIVMENERKKWER